MQELLDHVQTFVKEQAKLVDGRLKLYMYQAIVIALGLGSVVVLGAIQHRHAVQTIGVDAAPSVEAAENIKIHLQTIDSDFANVIIGKPGADKDSADEIGVTEDLLSKELVRASRNITFEKEQEQLQILLTSCFQMENLIGAASVYEDRGDPAKVAAYRDALDLLTSNSLPAADKLEEINHNELTAAYKKQNAESWITLALVLLFGIGMVISLRQTEKHIRVHFKRRKSVLLRVAMAVTTLAVIYTVTAFSLEWHFMSGIAYNDSYVSISELQQLLSTAYEAKATASRFLSDPAHQDDHEETHQNDIKKIVTFDNGKTYDTVYAELQVAIKAGKQKSFKISGVHGLLGQELDNVTFDGEMEAAADVVKALGTTESVDAKVRALEQSGQHEAAGALCIGQNEGELNWAYARLFKAVRQTIQVNDDHFKAAVGLGFAWLTGLYAGSVLLFIVLSSLVFFALKPRLGTFAFLRK